MWNMECATRYVVLSSVLLFFCTLALPYFSINQARVNKTPTTPKCSTEANTSLKMGGGVMAPYKFGSDVPAEHCPGTNRALPTVKGIISCGG